MITKNLSQQTYTMPSKQDKKPKLLWIQGHSCNGNSHSFLNLPNLENLIDNFEVIYHPILNSTHSYQEVTKCKLNCDILIFEGTFDYNLKRADISVYEVLKHYTQDAKMVVAVGSCASFGGIFKEISPESCCGLVFDKDKLTPPLIEQKGKVINLSGCPVHPKWLGFVLTAFLNEIKIYLDEQLRPVELYSSLAHHGCSRNEYFEWKVDSKNFGLKEGCLYYEQGCRAPMTHSSCNKILWNETSSKTRVGTPCFGCTEPDFPRKNLFTTQTNMSIPQEVPVGVSKRSYLTMAGIAKTFHIKRLEGKLIDYKTTD